MSFRLIVDFAAAATGVFLMGRMALRYRLLSKRAVRQSAACERRRTSLERSP
jgi:hypothetical protein